MATPDGRSWEGPHVCKGGPGKNHHARLPGGLVGLEGLSFILSCTEPWNTVYTLQGPTFPPRDVPLERFNSSRVPPNIRPSEHLSLYGLHQRPNPNANFGRPYLHPCFIQGNMNGHRQLFHLYPRDTQAEKLRLVIHKVMIGRFLEEFEEGNHRLSESSMGRVIQRLLVDLLFKLRAGIHLVTVGADHGEYFL
jgi:hypothetical protein